MVSAACARRSIPALDASFERRSERVSLMKLITSITLMSLLAVSALAQHAKSSASLSGHVTDFFGQPLPEATVELFTDSVKPKFTAVTDQHGSYRFTGLSAGEYNLVMSLRGFRKEASRVNLLGSESKLLNVGLEAGRLTDVPLMEVTGVVRQGGKPLSNATVILTNAFNQRESSTARTDKMGRYKIRVNNPGQYLVQASKPGLTVNVTPVVVTAWAQLQRQVVNLSLSPLRLPRADGSYER